MVKGTKTGESDTVRPFYHQIIEHSPLAIASVEGPEHILSYVNPAFCRLVAKEPEELIGIPFATAVPDAASFCLPHLDRVHGTGETVTCVTRMQSAPRPLYWALTVWADSYASTRPLQIIIQVTDTTQDELIHEKLTEVNEQLMLASIRQHELTEAAEKLNAELRDEIDQRKRVEEAVAHQASVLAGINRIVTEAVRESTEETWGATCLSVAQEVTGSKIGFIGKINKEGLLDDIAISDAGRRECRVSRGEGHTFLPTGLQVHGIYGRVIKDGKGFFTNSPDSHPDRFELPPGHPPLTSFLGVPLVNKNRTIGIVAVANREEGYSDAELQTLEQLAPAIVDALLHKQAEEQLRQARDELELRVRERTAKLRESEETALKRLAEIESYYDAAPVGLAVLDENLRFVRINQVLADINGVPAAEHMGRTPREIVPFLADEAERLARQIFESGEPIRDIELKGEKRTQPGVERILLESWHPLKNASERVIGITVVVQDITDQRRLEEHLRQAQKMEAIGTLAGGIAHDFNNMLAVILGNAELALDDIDETNGAMNASRRNIEQIIEASKRSRDLVKQILTFSRKSESRKRKPLKLSPLLKETVKLLRGSLPTTITISLDIATDTDSILADPSHIQQILMNLASNAAYAMREDGGILSISLSRITFNKGDPVLGSDMRPGRYLKLSVRDTGPGIPKKVRSRIFEPFFTTKKAGEGTGMGLALVYGLVKGHEGAITVESEPGKGASFNIFFPAQKKKAEEETHEQDSLPRGNESILLVDDEPLVVDMAQETLKRLGYTVTTAQGGSEAWTLFERNPDAFNLVITDHVMPDMTGMRLAERILKVREDFPIILFTGYSETVSPEKARAAGIGAFVVKPVAKRELAETVRRVLDGRSGTQQ